MHVLPLASKSSLAKNGVINLFERIQSLEQVGSYHYLFSSGGQRGSRDRLPNHKSLLHFLTIVGSRQPMPTRTEVLRDGAVSRKKTLSVPGRLEALHAPLPLPSRLMRVLRSIVEIPMLAMFRPREEFALGSPVTLEL